MNKLEKQFKKETNIDVLVPYTNEEIVYSSEYIEWLEAKINYARCCKSDSELLVCTYCGIQTNQEPCPHPKKCANKEKIKAN